MKLVDFQKYNLLIELQICKKLSVPSNLNDFIKINYFITAI